MGRSDGERVMGRSDGRSDGERVMGRSDGEE